MHYFLFVYCLDDDISLTPAVVSCPINDVVSATRLLQQRFPGSALYIYRAFAFDRETGSFTKLAIESVHKTR